MESTTWTKKCEVATKVGFFCCGHKNEFVDTSVLFLVQNFMVHQLHDKGEPHGDVTIGDQRTKKKRDS